MGATVHIAVACDGDATHLANDLVQDASERREGLARIINFLQSLAAGTVNGKLTVRVDSATAAAASLAITCTQADATAGDKLTFGLLDGRFISITGVAGAATAASGQYSIDTSDTAVATSVAAAINGYQPFKGHLTATSNAGVVTVTSAKTGTVGNSITVTETLTTATAFTFTGSALAGGANEGTPATSTVTITHASLAEDDSIRIGGTTLTWKASPSGEDQLDIKTTDATDAAELARGINAHSQLNGICTATSSGGVCTITYWCGGREGEALAVIEVVDVGGGMAQTAMTATSTDTYTVDAVDYDFGMD